MMYDLFIYEHNQHHYSQYKHRRDGTQALNSVKLRGGTKVFSPDDLLLRVGACALTLPGSAQKAELATLASSSLGP